MRAAPVAMRWRAAGDRDVGRERKNNEDAWLVAPFLARNGNGAFLLCAVADGMGGGVRGEEASALATATLQRTIVDGQWFNPEQALRAGVAAANEAIYRRGTGGGQGTRSAMGTTLVAALIHDTTGDTWIANVGDSRAYVATGGRARQVTVDHSLVGERVRAGLMTEAEARVSAGRNMVTRAVGLEPRVEADITQHRLVAGDTLVLCSDGFHAMVADPAGLIAIDAARLAPEGLPPALIGAALAAGGKDNIAVVAAGTGVTPTMLAADASESPTVVDFVPGRGASEPLAVIQGAPASPIRERLRRLPGSVVLLGAVAVAFGAALAALAATALGGDKSPGPSETTATPGVAMVTSPSATPTGTPTQEATVTPTPSPTAEQLLRSRAYVDGNGRWVMTLTSTDFCEPIATALGLQDPTQKLAFYNKLSIEEKNLDSELIEIKNGPGSCGVFAEGRILILPLAKCREMNPITPPDCVRKSVGLQ